jgi:hypothetical protein
MSQCRDLDPAERLLAGIVRLAIRDAQQERDRRLKDEAREFLWTVAPGIAERAGVAPEKSSSQVDLVPYSQHDRPA